jgi:DNA-directed RNA polymerase specialized sigma24 family protein
MEPWAALCDSLSSQPEAAWEELVVRYGTGLKARVGSVLRRCGVPPHCDQVEEIVQEVYCRLLAGGGRRLRRCRASSDVQVAAFLGKVAERVALDQLRAARALKRGGDQTDQGTMDERAVDPRANPEELVLGRERLRLFLERCSAAGGRGDHRRNARILALAVGGWTSHEIAWAVGGELSARRVTGLLRRMRRDGGARALGSACSPRCRRRGPRGAPGPHAGARGGPPPAVAGL